jgi:hypothetical protein
MHVGAKIKCNLLYDSECHFCTIITYAQTNYIQINNFITVVRGVNLHTVSNRNLSGKLSHQWLQKLLCSYWLLQRINST